MSIFAFGPFSSPSYSFPMLLIHSAFLLSSLRSYILHQNCFDSFSSGYYYVLVHFPNLLIEVFSYFGISYFVYIILSCHDIFLVFLLSPVPSGLFPCVVLFVLLVEPLFSFRPSMFQRFFLCLIFFCLLS